jgi:hypothetical protein
MTRKMVAILASEQEQPSSISQKAKGMQNWKGLVIALVVLLVVGLPLSYFVGNSSGFTSGYSKGVNEGYYEGYNKGRELFQFDFYYIKPEQKYGVYNLSDWLSRWKWIRPYQEGVFDCSEMSAYLEWKLENEGWHTKIIVGDSPFSSGKHAWLLVETSKGAYMPVESTNMDVVWWSSPYFDDYFKYDHEFETIQEALAYSETEFDWWKS